MTRTVAAGYCAVLLFAVVSLSARPPTTQTIKQLADIEFDHGTIYVSVVQDDGDGRLSGRFLAADPTTMQAVTIMASDLESLQKLRAAIDELMAELAPTEAKSRSRRPAE